MNTLDQTLLTISKHKGLRELQRQLKNDLRTAIEEPVEQEGGYCTCEPPEPDRVDFDVLGYPTHEYVCMNCDRVLEDKEPPFESELL